MGSIEKKAHAYSKNARCGPSTTSRSASCSGLVLLWNKSPVTSLPSSCYERTLPTLTTPGRFPYQHFLHRSLQFGRSSPFPHVGIFQMGGIPSWSEESFVPGGLLLQRS